MRLIQIALSISFLILLSSCGSEQQSATTTEPVNTEIPVTNPDELLINEDSLTDANLAAFPKHWVEIEIVGKEFIYTTYCNVGHPHWKLIQQDSAWQIETFYGQDAELWNVLSMTANLQSADGQELQEGIFVVTKETYPDDEIYEVSYFWNKTARFCTFGDFFNPGTQFADFTEFDSFTKKKEACPE